jgi:serine/threonine protein phosphatase 1
MPGRTLVIGDIHGCHVALEVLLSRFDVQPADTVVLIGDVIDRGPGSRQSIEILLGLQRRAQLVFVMGNHEEMLLNAIDVGDWTDDWLRYGGLETLESYGGGLESIPAEHVAFVRSGIDYFETDTEIFVHANLEPGVPLKSQPRDWLRWTRLTGFETPHPSGKRVICGHSPQPSGLPGILDGWIAIDTWAYHGLYLTGLDVTNDVVHQTSQAGDYRSFALEDLG